MRNRNEKFEAAATEPLVVTSTSDIELATYRFDVVEALRYMLSRVSRHDPLPRRLSLLAPLRQEGVTYLARGLAATLAHDLRATVCAVELNWWWPSSLPGDPQPGLAGVLTGQITLDAALVFTTDPYLAWLPAGYLDPGQRSLVARSQALEAVLAALSGQFDYLILDVPAIRATSDALPLASLGTAGCLILSQGGASISTAQQTVDEIAPLPIIGALINRVRLNTPRSLLKLISDS